MRLLPLFMVVAVLLCSCVAEDEERPGYWDRPLACELEGEFDGLAFSASLHLSAPDGEGGRDLSLCFSLPETMAGMTLTRAAGRLFVSRGDMSLPGERFAGWALAAELFSFEGELCEAGMAELDGRELSFFVMRRAGDRLKVYFEPESDAPCRFEGQLGGRAVAVSVKNYREGDGAGSYRG